MFYARRSWLLNEIRVILRLWPQQVHHWNPCAQLFTASAVLSEGDNWLRPQRRPEQRLKGQNLFLLSFLCQLWDFVLFSFGFSLFFGFFHLYHANINASWVRVGLGLRLG